MSSDTPVGVTKSIGLGLIGFAGSAFLASPLTTDIDYVREIVESLDTYVPEPERARKPDASLLPSTTTGLTTFFATVSVIL